VTWPGKFGPVTARREVRLWRASSSKPRVSTPSYVARIDFVSARQCAVSSLTWMESSSAVMERIAMPGASFFTRWDATSPSLNWISCWMGASAAISCGIFSEIVLIRNSRNLGRRKDCIFRQMRLNVFPVPGVVRFVRQLHRSGAVLALATSASRSRAHSTLLELGLLNCFAEVVTGEDVLLGKPDPTIYRLACHRIGIAPERLLAVEDAISGIRAAVGAGLRCIGVALHEMPENLISAGAAHVVRDFESISPGWQRLDAKTLVAAHLHDREPVLRPHLAQHAMHVVLDGLLGQVQLAGNFLIREPC